MRKIDIYIGEIETQIQFAKLSFNRFEESYRKTNISETFMSIHHFLIHISNIDKILDIEKSKMREAIFTIKIVDVDLKPFSRVRNHLKHYDDSLDKWIKKHFGKPFFDMNFIKGAKGYPREICLRAFDGKNMIYQNEDYDIYELYELLCKIDIDIQNFKKPTTTN